MSFGKCSNAKCPECNLWGYCSRTEFCSDYFKYNQIITVDKLVLQDEKLNELMILWENETK